MKEGVPKLILQLQQQEARLQTWESLTEEEIQEAIKTAEEWNSQGVPPEVQIDIAKKKSKSMVYHFTNKMYKWAGMRVFVLAARKTEKYKAIVQGLIYSWRLYVLSRIMLYFPSIVI
ncbi:uncharacterized protein F5147DRAFT_652897 [Suillus discolor]|uniref:Uncharacterized protein n=1 Tax=Suillus discolor TaxID=1912936 RepID=A0A9P7JTL3_9AGAM|nr:uncharacterized protein F5147DRAFT_652897 [Suillus discolor]KAG2108169.1 hypothetical protein F5147DRAFT_652897 [Suillus discolor]